MKAYYVTQMNGAYGPFTNVPKLEAIYQGQGFGLAIEASLGGWALALLDADNHDLARNDPDTYALPSIDFDATLGTLSSQQRQALLDKMTSLGVSTSGITNQTTFREILRRLGKHHRIEFSENAFDVNR